MANKARIRRRGQRGARTNVPTRRATDMDRMLGMVAKELRQQLKISQEKLAKGVGVTFQQIQKYESGHNRISGGMLDRLAVFMAVHPGEFFDLARAKLAVRQ